MLPQFSRYRVAQVSDIFQLVEFSEFEFDAEDFLNLGNHQHVGEGVPVLHIGGGHFVAQNDGVVSEDFVKNLREFFDKFISFHIHKNFSISNSLLKGKYCDDRGLLETNSLVITNPFFSYVRMAGTLSAKT